MRRTTAANLANHAMCGDMRESHCGSDAFHCTKRQQLKQLFCTETNVGGLELPVAAACQYLRSPHLRHMEENQISFPPLYSVLVHAPAHLCCNTFANYIKAAPAYNLVVLIKTTLTGRLINCTTNQRDCETL